ncbi:MAG: TonB-dependent receptor [Moraxellaceae bacterium]|nr:TonB-dependent receptor [Moraxellaceae bacterium]
MERQKGCVLGLLSLLAAPLETARAATAEPLVLAANTDLLTLPLEDLGRLRVDVATGTPTPLAATPAATSLRQDTDVRALGSRTVDEALAGIPGLHVSSYSGPQGTTRYYFRGLSAGLNTQALIMVNGIPVTTVGISNLPLEGGLPMAQVRRIEVIRGPGSAVHGVDAFGGVINIITKDAADLPGTQAGASYGSFDTFSSHVSQSGKLAGADALLQLAYSGTQGDDSGRIDSDTQTLFDQLGGTSASRAPGPTHQQLKRFDAYSSFKWQEVDAHFFLRQIRDYGVSPAVTGALDPVGLLSWQRAGGDVSWHRENPGGWSLQAQLTAWHLDIDTQEPLRLYPAGAFNSFPDGLQDKLEINENTARATVTAIFEGWKGHRLRLGAGWGVNDLVKVRQWTNYLVTGPGTYALRPGGLTEVSDTPASGLPEEDRKVTFAVLQDEWQLLPRWHLTAGLRHDRFDDFDEVTTPRLTLAWQARPDLTAKLIHGEAFRAPSVTDVAFGNGNIGAERLRSTELGLSWLPDAHWNGDLNLYRFVMRDLITLVPGPTLQVQNSGRGRGHGAELEVGYQDAGWRLLGNVSVQRTHDESSGDDLGLAPDYLAYLRLSRDLAPGWQLSSQLNHVGQRQRAPGDTQPALDGYTTLDLHLRHLAAAGLEIFLTGRNLLDDDITEPGIMPVPSSIPLPGLSVSVGFNKAWD